MNATVLDDLIRYRTKNTPEKTAILFQDQSISYLEFNTDVSRATRMLYGLGIERGERVGLMFPNCPEMLFLYFACFRLGAIVVPINTRYQRSEIEYALEHSECSLLLVDQQFYSKVESLDDTVASLSKILILCDRNDPHKDNLHVHLANAPPEAPLPQVLPEDPAVIFYTSGSTARPKGVIHTHSSLLRNGEMQIATRGINRDTIWLVSTGVGYVAGLSGVTIPAFRAGCSLVLVPDLQADNLLQAIERHQVDTTLLLPTMLLEMLESKLANRLDLSSLRACFVAGDECSHDLYQRFRNRMGHDLLQAFGMTECEGYLSNRPSGPNRNGTVGIPAEGITLRLIDAEGNDVATGTEGEILIQGDSVMKGYWEDSENTHKTLRDGWLYSGDIATCDEQGFYTFRERNREIIIHGGSNVGPHEVEDIIDSHQDVKESCVVGVPDSHYGALLVAYVALESDASQADLSDLQNWTREHLAAYKVPDFWYQVDRLPKTATGKIDRKALHIRAEQETMDSTSKSFSHA